MASQAQVSIKTSNLNIPQSTQYFLEEKLPTYQVECPQHIGIHFGYI